MVRLLQELYCPKHMSRIVPIKSHQVCFQGIQFSWFLLVSQKIRPVLGPGPCMEHALDIEELRTQMASERLAREQADDRCMDNIRDMINEERI